MMQISTFFKKQNSDTLLLILLGLFSLGGGSGRIIFGLGIFDFLLFIMLLISLLRINSSFKVKIADIQIVVILMLVLLFGIFRTKFGENNITYDYFITELRFFIYMPVVYFITSKYKFSLIVFERLLPYILLFYIPVWLFLLKPGNFLFNFFNNDIISTIGTQARISGPPILILIPLLLLLINQKTIKPLIVGLYSILILIIFIKTGGRTYFVFFLFPIFYIMYKRRKNIKLFILSVILIIFSFVVLKEITSSAFFERFLNITRVTEDTSFVYRVLNIEEMLNRLKGSALWLGHGIGSKYEVNLYGWKKSFFLDNTFITLIYKIGILGLLGFLSIFLLTKKQIPKDLYFFELFSLILIGAISYHLILNPVFLLGYFIIFNYFRKNETWDY